MTAHELSAARDLYDEAIELASSGNLPVLQALPWLAQRLLGAGRSAYGAGPQFQELFSHVNSGLARVFDQQAAAHEAVLAEMPAELRAANQDIVAQLMALREELHARRPK